jgi:hypothetical protein
VEVEGKEGEGRATKASLEAAQAGTGEGEAHEEGREADGALVPTYLEGRMALGEPPSPLKAEEVGMGRGKSRRRKRAG